MAAYDDYDTEPIGGGNPYHRCSGCGRSVPEINGRLEKHAPLCPYRLAKTQRTALPMTRDVDLGYARGLLAQADERTQRGLHIEATEKARQALKELRAMWPEYYDLVQRGGMALLHNAGF